MVQRLPVGQAKTHAWLPRNSDGTCDCARPRRDRGAYSNNVGRAVDQPDDAPVREIDALALVGEKRRVVVAADRARENERRREVVICACVVGPFPRPGNDGVFLECQDAPLRGTNGGHRPGGGFDAALKRQRETRPVGACACFAVKNGVGRIVPACHPKALARREYRRTAGGRVVVYFAAYRVENLMGGQSESATVSVNGSMRTAGSLTVGAA